MAGCRLQARRVGKVGDSRCRCRCRCPRSCRPCLLPPHVPASPLPMPHCLVAATTIWNVRLACSGVILAHSRRHPFKK